jgi:hypothetical protein
MKQHSETSDIFLIIESHKVQGKYFAGMVRISKSLKYNKVTRVVLGKTCNENYTLEEAKKMYLGALAMVKADKLTLVTSVSILKHDYFRSPFDIKNEDELVKNYRIYQDSIQKGKSSLTPQKIGVGKGLYLDDLAKPVRLRIDFNDIKISTISIMFAIDVVLKNETQNLLRAIEVLNK